MKKIWVNNKKINIPEKWDELFNQKRKLLKIVALFFQKLEKMQFLTLVGIILININPIKKIRILRIIRKYPESKQAEHLTTNLYFLSQQILFSLDKKIKVRENLFPRLFWYNPLFGSKNILRNFELWEFAIAEKHFFDYRKNQSENSLNLFIATWYRPFRVTTVIDRIAGRFNGDLRIKFNDYSITKRAKRVAKIPIEKKYLIYLFFVNEYKNLQKMYPNTYKNVKDVKQNHNSWADTILAMTEIGNEEKAGSSKLAVVLQRIELNNINYKKMKITTDE